MKINHVNDSSATNIGTNRANGSSKSNGSAATGKASSGEKLSISELSTRLNDLEAQLSGSKEFDPAKVDAIKQAIRDGHFKINSEVVADRLIESAKLMLGK
jgi:negative regulator of flagellin synthesis FlgM